MGVSSGRRPVFFLRRSDRLIARLRHMLYGLRFARQAGGQLIVAWPRLNQLSRQFDGDDYSYSHVIDLRQLYASGRSSELVFYDCVAQYPPGLMALDGPEFKAVRPDRFDLAYFLEQCPTVYSGAYHGYQFAQEAKSQAEMDAEVREIYRALPLPAVVRTGINAIRAHLQVEEYAALHVRRGDVGEMLRAGLPKLAAGKLDDRHVSLMIGHYLARTAPDDFYYEPIRKEIAAGRRIVFFSDSPETFNHFAMRLGPGNFIDINKLSRAPLPIVKAFVDFNMMSGASRIITTGSTYGAFASIIGDSPIVNVSPRGVRGGKSVDVDRLEEFIFQNFAPDLAANRSVRHRIRTEIERALRERPRPGGDGADGIDGDAGG